MMSTKALQQLENFRWSIQHLIHESGYLYDDDESNYPLSKEKWMLQTHGKFMKYVLFTLHRMTPVQLKMNPIKPIIKVKTNDELDKEEGETMKYEEGSTETCQELSEEQKSTSDIYTKDKEDSKSMETSQDHNVLNKSIPNEVDSHTVKHVTEIELHKENGSKIMQKRTNSLLPILKLKWKTKKLKGSYPIHLSNKLSNSRLILEVTKKYGE